MEKILIILFYSMEKTPCMRFSYGFGDKRTNEKAQVSFPEYGKNACYKIS